jgi:hypothetical protein
MCCLLSSNSALSVEYRDSLVFTLLGEVDGVIGSLQGLHATVVITDGDNGDAHCL